MSDRAYRDLYYEEPHVQAEFERLVQNIRTAEQARQPVSAQHSQAERAADSGKLSGKAYRDADDAYIAANNKIAAAQRAVDDFLRQNHNYKTR